MEGAPRPVVPKTATTLETMEKTTIWFWSTDEVKFVSSQRSKASLNEFTLFRTVSWHKNFAQGGACLKNPTDLDYQLLRNLKLSWLDKYLRQTKIGDTERKGVFYKIQNDAFNIKNQVIHYTALVFSTALYSY